jgi:predicted P-loop ATPase/GTPase
MQAHTLGPLRKIFYIKPEVYNKLREIAMEKRISIDDCAEELLREHFMLEEFIQE